MFKIPLLTTETGSFMWGMQTETSDHDWFHIYVASTRALCSGYAIPKTMPALHCDMYDHQYIEIGHCINLILKGNINYIQAITSPLIIEHTTDDVILSYIMELRGYILDTPVRNIWHSANGMSINQEKDAVKRADTRDPQKSLRTAYRTLSFAEHVMLGYGYQYAPINRDVTTEDVRRLRETCQTVYDINPNCIEESFDEWYIRGILYQIRMAVLNKER